MIFFALGPFGPFAAWWDSMVARIVEIGLGPVTVVSAEAPEELAGHLIRSVTPNLVVVARRPSPELRALMVGSGAPLLVGFGDPREGLFELVVRHGHDLRLATSLLADSFAAAVICAGMPKALVVGADVARRDTPDAFARVAQLCGIAIASRQTGIAVPPGPSIEAKEWWEALGPDERSIAEGAFRAYETWLAGHGFVEITWDRRLFFCAADRERGTDLAINVGEAPSLLVHGPWVSLPPGGWAATVTLAVSREINGARFDIAIHPGPLATGAIICDGRGLGSATLLFTIEPASGHTISVTVASTGSPPGGRLAFGNVVLAPSPGEGSGIPVELSSALSL
ncbi:MAG TPA: hypothetical protein VGG57_23625 [Stellaceae bacterium]|jgi:hypothetical protein